MTEFLMSKVIEFRQWRHAIHHVLNGISQAAGQHNADSLRMLAWYESLLALPVSKLSTIGDQVWDFNADEPNAARNVQGPKLRIDFGQFQNLNQLALLEVKIALFCRLKMPSSFKTFMTSGKSLKANTAIAVFKSGLHYLNTMSAQARKILTDDFFESEHHGVAYFDAGSYRDAAAVHPFAYGPDIRQFFNVLRSPFLCEHVFGESLPYVELDALVWAKRAKESSESEKAYRILPNDIFEKGSREASYAVVDFLDALGETILDLDTLGRRNAKGYSLAAGQGLTRYKFNLYVALRLRRKGYDTNGLEAALDDVWPEFYSEKFEGRFKNSLYLQGLSETDLDNEFRLYINFVSYSACYLVAQYTGMRPSELSDILVDTCLEEESGYWLVVSNIIKHRQNLSKLFDDKWIAIPIVRDAIRAAQFIAKIKQNPYLFSNVDTVAQGATPSSMGSTGITHQFSNFFMEILSDEEYESLEFSPYTLRHTLAYQMARAELGLPFISYQLKHFGDLIGAAGQNKAFSEVTLGYGAIADILSKGGRSGGQSPRDLADREYVENFCDPDGSYAGPNAEGHRTRLKKVFDGYMAAGHTKDEIFAQMVKKRLAVINVGQGFCYGGRKEDFDESLPCIGSLRCNPNRCKNAVVTKANAPKWREIYVQNHLALMSPVSEKREEEIRAAMNEAKGVLEYLGEEVEV
ncbi:tyrosine-type recombinase/integrase [Pseudomonas sp. GCM10022186]|uniref:tyrosine-type recombinase/integrase n=1 Tax=Pseudomonas sp. GCM10022186 TaxID=3252650 RepID=UPI0036146BFB